MCVNVVLFEVPVVGVVPRIITSVLRETKRAWNLYVVRMNEWLGVILSRGVYIDGWSDKQSCDTSDSGGVPSQTEPVQENRSTT